MGFGKTLGGWASKGWGAAKTGAGAVWGNKAGRGAVIGGAIGGYQGSDNGFGGMLGGAAFGAAAGGAMGQWGDAAMGKIRSGYGKLGEKAVRGMANNKWLAAGGANSKRIRGAEMAMKGIAGGGNLITNKHAGAAMFALGAGSASLIGSSMLGSNRSL